MNTLHHTAEQLYDRALADWYAQYRRYRRFIDRRTADQQLNYWRSQARAVLDMGKNGYRLTLKELGLTSAGLAQLEHCARGQPEVVIADIDRNGFLLSHFGPIADMPATNQHNYLPRRRFEIQLVAREGYAGVRKSYGGSKQHFVNELKILHTLVAARCHVPAIMAIDFDVLALTMSYIGGSVLKDQLALRGARLYSDGPGNRAGRGLRERYRVRARRAGEGTRVLAEVVDQQFLRELFQELCRIHQAGVLDLDVKYGNIIKEIKTQRPYWIDFEHATLYTKLSPNAFRILSRRDVIKFNQFFGTTMRAAVPLPPIVSKEST